MNVENLSQRLKAELCRNKAKSAVLIVMCLVAAYFWIPLLGKWLLKSSSTAEVKIAHTDASTLSGTQPSVSANTHTASVAVNSTNWRSILQRLETPLMKSVHEFPLTRNPFANSNLPEVTDVDDRHEEESEQQAVDVPAAPLPPTFAELGLVLHGTLVGKRARMAMINRQTYREKELIQVRLDAGAGSHGVNHVVVELESVHADNVVVSFAGNRHKMPLQPLKSPRAGRIVNFRP